jgi:hypothetical protein
MALFAHPILLATGSALVILLLFFFVEYLIECGDVKKGNFITLAPFEWSYESVDGPYPSEQVHHWRITWPGSRLLD